MRMMLSTTTGTSQLAEFVRTGADVAGSNVVVAIVTATKKITYWPSEKQNNQKQISLLRYFCDA